MNIDDRNYDALVIMNGNVNYFGGVDDPSQTLNYYIINHFKNKVFYVLCDCNLLLKQIWPGVSKKKWSSNYKEEDINITRDDIIYISQARDTKKVLDKARKQNININNVIHFPFEKFPLLFSKELEFNENPAYDLLYGGTFRNGRREEDMVKFYFGLDEKYDVTMFGKIEADNFNEKKIAALNYPKFEGAVAYDEFNKKMNEAKATVIIGDPLYKSWADLAQRIYESIYAKNVVLIDGSYDYRKIVFRNPELRDFNYVNDRREVANRLEKLKDPEFRRHIVELQSEDVKMDNQEYCNSLLNIIKEQI